MGITAGAFGAHMIAETVSEEHLEVWQTGARYQMIVAAALIGLAGLLATRIVRVGWAIPWMIVAGVVLFSGSLYLIALTGVSAFGIVTPIGGTLLIIGWSIVAIDAWPTDGSRRVDE